MNAQAEKGYPELTYTGVLSRAVCKPFEGFVIGGRFGRYPTGQGFLSLWDERGESVGATDKLVKIVVHSISLLLWSLRVRA